MAEIDLHAISHSYDARRAAPSYALRDVELRWRDGGAYALLGPSGCGKTTLLGIISGLIQPTRGRVSYAGKDVTALSSRERNIAQVFQFPVIYDTMTVRQNLAFPLRNRGLGVAEIDRRVGRIAEILELTDVLRSRATRLSADQKQILALGRGLVREDVAAILFDEPLTVIDPHRKWLLRRKLKEIHKQFRHTLIYVTHDQTEALTFADEVVVMQHGQVLQRGTPEDLFRRPAHTYVGYFIGSPGMNVIPCEVERDAGGGRARIGDHDVALPAYPGTAAPSGRLELGIRPEHIVVLDDAEPDGGLPVSVTAVEDHGRFRIITGVLGGVLGGHLGGVLGGVLGGHLGGVLGGGLGGVLGGHLGERRGEPPEGERAGAPGDHRIKIRVGHAGARAASAVAAGATVRVRFPPEHICLYRDSQIVAAGDGPTSEASP